MLKLYGGARSRASIVQWYLEELGLPYEFALLEMQTGEHRQPAYLDINPFGKVPAITEGDFKLWESGAILLYLSEKYDSLLATPEQHATAIQWVMFANATLGPGVFVESSREKEMPRLFAALNPIFQRQSFVMGDRFTVADVAIGSTLAYMPIMLKINFEGYEAIAAYVKQILERPAFQKTIGARTS
ncbi:MAG: glutathione S-transferase family protein [Leptolyngbyaceae cyanobacterium CRU_2_3]|nr:glutathione S-transferase family protein [Leptolyngbyaceae cyanobacterium CRU_2_3]